MAHTHSGPASPIKPMPIKQGDVINSVTDALQYISYYHSPDFIKAMAAA